MKAHFHFYADPAHAWLAVTRDDLAALGLIVEQFSSYSYVNGETIYLEEDMDASLFLAAYEAKAGRKPELVTHLTDGGPSLIRTYRSLSGSKYTFEESMRLFEMYSAQTQAA